MPGPSNTLLIEGAFDELAEELANYLDDVKRKQGDTSTAIHTDISQILEQKDEVLKKLVTGSAALNTAPEKGLDILRIWEISSDGTDLWLQSSSQPTTS